MANVTARIKIKGKNYETSVDLDEALKVRDGKGDVISALQSNGIYYDLSKANIVPSSDLKSAFGTADLYKIAKKIITSGEIQKTQEFRDAQREEKIKKILNLIVKNAMDQNGRPYTEERIKRAIEEVHYNFDNRPAEQQVPEIINKLKPIIPISFHTKKIRIKVPARFTGHVYGLFKEFKESENWLPNGDLEVIINIPAGMQIDFYDKLNSATHGAIQSEDLTKQ